MDKEVSWRQKLYNADRRYFRRNAIIFGSLDDRDAQSQFENAETVYRLRHTLDGVLWLSNLVKVSGVDLETDSVGEGANWMELTNCIITFESINTRNSSISFSWYDYLDDWFLESFYE